MMLHAGPGDDCWPPHQSGCVIPPAGNEIHLWRAPLDIDEGKLRTLEMLLQPDELERAARFHFPGHRAHFIAARGILRTILGIHTGCEPQNLRFAYGEHGKPLLAEPAGGSVEFNLSHSGGLAVYAVTLGGRVGVDVEFIKPGGSWMEIARRYFTPSEAEELSSLSPDAMSRRFFEMWSGKEARMKAMGTGLLFEKGEEDAPLWTVRNFVPMAGYVGALATESARPAPAIVKHHFAA